MQYPCIWENLETGKKFAVAKNNYAVYNGEGERIKAVELGGQRGECDFHVRHTELDLHVIQSHPQRSGLGSLLMFLLAVEAVRNNCTMINILNAAANERVFYQRMGCGPDLRVVEAALLASESPRQASLEVWPGVFLAPSRTPSVAEGSRIVASAPWVGTTDDILKDAGTHVAKRWKLVDTIGAEGTR